MFYPFSASANSNSISEMSSNDASVVDGKNLVSIGSRGGSFKAVKDAGTTPLPTKADIPKSDLIVLMDIDLTMVKTHFFPTDDEAQAFSRQLPCDMLHHCKRIGQSFAVVQLRPGLPEFLKNLASRCEMHIFTAGTQKYANAIERPYLVQFQWFVCSLRTRPLLEEYFSAAIATKRRFTSRGLDRRQYRYIDCQPRECVSHSTICWG
jgi:hypothetical protein